MKTLVLALLATPALSSDVFVVDHGGGGDFTTIQDGVDAASPGDTLLVKGGAYHENVLIGGKGLTVVAEAGEIVSVLGGMVVRFVPEGQTCELIRLRSLGDHDSPLGFEHGLAVMYCSGPVRLESCVFKGSEGLYFTGEDEHGGDGVHVIDSFDVSLMGCVVLGGDAGETWSCQQGLENRAGHALRVLKDASPFGSLVTVHDSVCTAGDAKEYDIQLIECGGMHAHGAWVVDSQIYTAGSSFTGGRGGTEGLCFLVFPGGDGIRVQGAGAHADILDTGLFGGPPGMYCNTQPGQPLQLLDGATATTLAGVARSMTSESPVRAGDKLPLTFEAPAGETVFVAMSFFPGWQDHIPFLAGPWLLHGPTKIAVVGQMPANGVFNRTLPVPPIAGGLDSEVRYYQAIFSGSAGTWLGSPNTVVVLDPQF